tara:strand:+ start:95 stop:475 length:381 start_codon:yes stop_codon:yes gene_type:complete
VKLNHHKYKQNYINYIFNCVETDSEGKPIQTEAEKAKYIIDRFYKEYGFQVDRIGKQKAIAEWLSGLALNIEYYYQDIVQLAIDMGSIDSNPSDELQEKVIDNYWSFMARIIILIENKLNKGAFKQ